MKRIVIVGAGLAGLRAAETLRGRGFDGGVVLVGDEPHRPYDRPPLSKSLLCGDTPALPKSLRDGATYDLLRLDMRLGRRAVRLDDAVHVVQLDDGCEVGYDALVIATGARARRLPLGTGLARVHVLRTIDDCIALRGAFSGARHVTVVGAGFIGCEVAASARRLGLEVTLVEALPTPLARVLGVDLGTAIGQLHRRNGVDVRSGVGVTSIEGAARAERVVLDDGTVLATDVVVVGVGAEPVTDWLSGSGVAVEGGVLCDQYCESTVAGVYAAGDVVRWWHPTYQQYVRFEHWTNATEMGVRVAHNLLARRLDRQPFAPVPYFWSDQYSTKVQCLGLPEPADDVRVVAGSLDDDRFLALCGREGRLSAVVGFGMPAQVMRLRPLLATGSSFEAALADFS